MAEAPQSNGGGNKGKKRAKKQSTRIDMTPMVDLAFLLLTFFILTTTLAEQKTFDITMPIKDPNDTANVSKVNNAATLILTDKDEIIYYYGEFKGTKTVMMKTNFKEIRKVLQDKNKPTLEKMLKYEKDFYKRENYDKMLKKYGNKDALDSIVQTMKDSIWRGDKLHNVETGVFAIIKYDGSAKYRNIVDMIDEMDIVGIRSYAIVEDLTPPEKQIMEATFGKKIK
jgi:biopolymer transport protein ExbD